jgi:hypothetical protein
MRVTKIQWIAVGFALAALAVFAMLVLTQRAALQSDPNGVRDSKDYDRVLGPSRKPPSDHDPFELLSKRATEQSLEISYFSADSGQYDSADYTVEQVGEDQRFSTDAGRLALEGMALILPEAGFEKNSRREPERFFHPDLAPYSPDEVETKFRKRWERQISVDSLFPTVRFLFSTPDASEFLLQEAVLFDARTHRLLGNRHSSQGGADSPLAIDMELAAWHSGPVDLVVTAAFGPVEQHLLPAEEGAVVRFGRLEVKLLAVGEGVQNGWSSSSNQGTNSILINFEHNPIEEQVTCVFATYPGAGWFPISFDLLNADGEVARNAGSGRTGAILLVSARQSRDSLAAIRINHYPTVRRLVFRIPEIPGMPEQNRGVDNLFDVVIPYSQVRAEFEFRELISKTVQMPIRTGGITGFPAGYFPKTFVNTTAREVLNEYLAALPEKRLARIDSETGSIELEAPLAVRLLERLRQLTRRFIRL